MRVNFEKLTKNHRMSYEEFEEFKDSKAKERRKGYKTKDIVYNKRFYPEYDD